MLDGENLARFSIYETRKKQHTARKMERLVARGKNPAIEAAEEHDPDLLKAAHAAGHGYPDNVSPVMMVATGLRPMDLDDYHHQSEEGISKILDAMRETGVNLNAPIDGKPAAHRLCEYYGAQIVGSFYDTRYEAEIGLTDRGQAGRLAVFAQKGVDFSIEDERGRSPFALINDIARCEAEKRGQDPSSVLTFVMQQVHPARQVARNQRVAAKAAERAAAAGPEAVNRKPELSKAGRSFDD